MLVDTASSCDVPPRTKPKDPSAAKLGEPKATRHPTPAGRRRGASVGGGCVGQRTGTQSLWQGKNNVLYPREYESSRCFVSEPGLAPRPCFYFYGNLWKIKRLVAIPSTQVGEERPARYPRVRPFLSNRRLPASIIWVPCILWKPSWACDCLVEPWQSWWLLGINSQRNVMLKPINI